MISKGLLTLAAAGYAVAQSSSTCKFSATQTIDSPAATSIISNCDVVSGSLDITASGAVDISGPKEITGDIRIENNGNITSFTSSSLETIGGTLSMQGVTSLASLSLSKLSDIDEFDLITAPLLQGLGLGTLSSVNKMTIEDTFISSLDGVVPDKIDTFKVSINKRLTDISMPFQSASTEILISANGQTFSASFPKMAWASAMTIQNVTTFSAPALVAVNNSLQFDSNYFTSVTCPNLTETGNSLSFIGNSEVTNISFPILTKVGGALVVLNNTNLDSVTGFPKLKEVDGAVVVKGTYTEVTMPDIDVVQGTAVFSSSGDISKDCKTFQGSNMDNVWGGKLTCIANNTAAATDSSTTSTAGGSGGSNGSGSSNSTAAGLTVNNAMLGLVAIGFAQALW